MSGGAMLLPQNKDTTRTIPRRRRDVNLRRSNWSPRIDLPDPQHPSHGPETSTTIREK